MTTLRVGFDPILNGTNGSLLAVVDGRLAGVTTSGHIVNGMTAANIREVYDNFDVIFWDEPITLTGNQTIDLTDLVSKSTFILPSGQPVLTTDASTALIVGGGDGDFNSLTHAPYFYGDFWIYASGTRTNGTRGVHVNAATFRLYFEQLWLQNWGGGIQGTRGEIKTVVIDRFFAWDFVAFGAEFFSDDYLKEISEIFITGMTEGNTTESGAEGIYYSWGSGCGSAGKIGGVVKQGVCYRQKSVAKHWSVREINSASWSSANGGQMTYVLEDYHSLPVGGNVSIGDFDNAGYNNMTSTPWVAVTGTTGKTIVVAMPVDPGAYTQAGYFSYNYRVFPAGFNDYERPRKISYYDLSGRGQRGNVFDTRAGGNLFWSRCIADDAGVSDPNGLVCTAVWSSAAGGTVTYETFESDGITPAPHELSPGDYFNTRYFSPSGYSISAACTAVVDSNTFTCTVADFPGFATDPGPMLRDGSYYKPITLTANGWYFGQNAGSYNITECEAHENYQSAVYDDRMTNERSVIDRNRFFNSSYGLPDPPVPVADIYMRPGRANMTITNNILGAGDTWRFASKSFVFSGNPAAGDYVGLKLNADTATTYFIFATEADDDSSQPQVLIAATAAETIANLCDAIHARDDDNCNGVQASPRDANLGTSGTIDRLLIVRTIPGAIGKDYTLEDGSSVISFSPSGSSLAGGTGAATASYGIMNVTDSLRGNVVQGNQAESHTIAPNNMDPAPEAPTIRQNLLDNGDFSLDQANEGAAVTITSAGTGTRIVDRWFATRGTTNVTGQRVAGTEFANALKITGAGGNTSVVITQRFEGARVATLETKNLIFSCYVYATGVVKAALRAATADALDNFAAVTTIKLRQYVITTTPQRLYFSFLGTAAISNGLELSIRFTDGVGAGQNVTIEGAKLEESGLITQFVPDLPEDTLFSCQQYYRKSFPSGTAPAQNAGTTGAVVGAQTIAGAVAQEAAAVDFNPPMRTSPTVTLYNPSAANAQIRNTTAGSDWSGSTSTPSASNASIRGTGPGGGAAGDVAAIHYVADADFP